MQSGKFATSWRYLLIPLIVIIVVVADILTKNCIRGYPYGTLITTIGFLDIIHINNTGAAFGMFQGQVIALRTIAIITLAVIVGVGVYIARRYKYLVTIWNLIGFGLITGGTLGNLVDRFRFGPVTDFIDPSFFPAFNVADSSITIGAIMLAISVLRLASTPKAR